jgi:hypothetical protein
MPHNTNTRRATAAGCRARPLRIGMGAVRAPGSPVGDRMRPGRTRHLVGRQDAMGSNCERHHRRAL